jgi:hypothetical protein
VAQNDWEIAEDLVRVAVGGERTPGSGNKSIKGDVRVRKDGWMFEVKQTSKTKLSIQRKWFTKLELFKDTNDICLVIFFGNQGYPYYFEYGGVENYVTWENTSVTEDSLPKILYTPNGQWVLDDWNSLYDLKK